MITVNCLSLLPAPSGISRRRLIGISLATCAMTALPISAELRYSQAEASTWWQLLLSGTKWLAENALSAATMSDIGNWISNATGSWFHGDTYHDKWSYPVQFNINYPLNSTGYGTYFGVERHPVITNEDNYESNSDLNWAEINGLAAQQKDHTSRLYTVGPTPKLLPGFTGARRPATSNDAADVSDFINADPTLSGGEDYDLSYVRDFCTCNGPMRGYALKAANNPNASDYKFRIYKV